MFAKRRDAETAYRRGFSHAIQSLSMLIESRLPEDHPVVRLTYKACDVNMSMRFDGQSHPLYTDDFLKEMAKDQS